MSDAPEAPTEIRLKRKSRVVEVGWADGTCHVLPFEYLRVNSPSAEVRGHGPGQEVLLIGKENVAVKAIEPVGNYAVRLVFDDGHDSGLYGWGFLRWLGENRESNWAAYLERLAEVGYRRKDPSA